MNTYIIDFAYKPSWRLDQTLIQADSVKTALDIFWSENFGAIKIDSITENDVEIDIKTQGFKLECYVK